MSFTSYRVVYLKDKHKIDTIVFVSYTKMTNTNTKFLYHFVSCTKLRDLI